MLEEFVATVATSAAPGRLSRLREMQAINPAIRCKPFRDHFKVLKAFDKEGNLMLVRSYESEKQFTVLRNAADASALALGRIFRKFGEEKALVEAVSGDFVVRFVEAFCDENPANPQTVFVYRVLEEVEYPLFNSNQPRKTALAQLHVIKHFNENELLQILLDLTALFHRCEVVGRKPMLSDALICYSEGRYRLLLWGFEEGDPTARRPVAKALFDESENVENGSKPMRVRRNKLDLQKSSHTTRDSDVGVSPEAPCRPSNAPPSPPPKNRCKFSGKDLYQFAITMCNGLFKDMASAFFGNHAGANGQPSPHFSEEKFSKFASFLSCLRSMSNAVSAPDQPFRGDEWTQKIEKLLEGYSEEVFSLKNEEILLLNQPIFARIRRLRVEVSHDAPSPATHVAFLTKELARMPDIVSLELLFNDCLLNSREVEALLEQAEGMEALEHLVLKLCHNNLESDFVTFLRRILEHRSMETFDLSACE